MASEYAETEHPSVEVRADPLLTIDSKRNSPALGPGFRSVAKAGLAVRLPLWLLGVATQ